MFRRFRRRGVGVIELAVALGMLGLTGTALTDLLANFQGCVPDPSALGL